MRTKAEIICDSKHYGNRLTTFVLEFPRLILPQFLTHRAFSRNTASSRAVPVTKLVDQVRSNPYIPLVIGQNCAGMEAKEILGSTRETLAKAVIEKLSETVADAVQELHELGVHKQTANRYLEPFLMVRVIATMTDDGIGNFFSQRLNHDAQPEIQELAQAMQKAYHASTPRLVTEQQPWHLPYWDDSLSKYDISTQMQVCVARVARVSYARDAEKLDLPTDLSLAYRLFKDRHWSPFEHIARPKKQNDKLCNFAGWTNYRTIIQDGEII